MRLDTLTLVSTTELLMDRDNLTFTERVTRWVKDPANKDRSQAGDDRSPAWAWLGKLHYDEQTGLVSIPQGMLSACLRAAATMIPHPTAKAGKTLKEVSQSGMIPAQSAFPLYVLRGTPPAWSPIDFEELYAKLGTEEDFEQHVEVAKLCGFRVDVRRSQPRFGSGRHVRVRPMFGPWRCVCQMQVTDEVLTEALVYQIFALAGRSKGMGNWRPSCGRAGSYGTFDVVQGIPEDLPVP
jgi:hypothetical protein